MKHKICILSLLIAFMSLMAIGKPAAADKSIKLTFYKTRVDDTKLDVETRLKYIDSVLAIDPDDKRMHMIKSDICYRLGNYDQAATEYMTIARRFKDELIPQNRLRALKMLAQSLSLGGHQAEAASIALELLHEPKEDSLQHYDLTAINVIIGQALMAHDTISMNRFLGEQDRLINTLVQKGYLDGDNERQYRFVQACNRMTCLWLRGDYNEALTYAKKAKSYAATDKDSAEVDIQIADVYAEMGQYDIAIDLYKRNLNRATEQFNRRVQCLALAKMYNKIGLYGEALEVLSDFPDAEDGDANEASRQAHRANALAGLGRYKEAYEAMAICANLRDSLTESGNNFSASLREFEVGEARFQADKARTNSHRSMLVAAVAVIITVGALILVGLMVLRLRRNRTLTTRLAQEVAGKDEEFREIRDENAHKDRQLVSSALSLTRMAESLASIEQLASDGGANALSRIASEIKSLNYTKNVWDIFRTSFERLNPGFFGALTRDFPSLSIGEQRMAAYIVMGLTSKEIASIINRQPRTVETIKYRLRKELNLPADVSTADFLRRYMP